MSDGSSIEERAKIHCGGCGVFWPDHPMDDQSTCWRYRPKPEIVPYGGHLTLTDEINSSNDGVSSASLGSLPLVRLMGGLRVRNEPGELRTIGYVSAPQVGNGHATQKDAMIKHIESVGLDATIVDLESILGRLGTIESDLRAVPDAGDRLNIARHGVGLAMEFIEREIQRLKGD